MKDPWRSERSSYTVFANVAIAKQGGIHAQQPIVVQRVNHWYVFAVADVKQRGRERRKPIVNVHNARAKCGKSSSEPRLCGCRQTKLAERNLDLCHDALNGIVVSIKPLDLDSICSQQTCLCVNYGIFSASLLVSIVDY